MPNKQKKPTKSCSDCIHENACRAWVDGRYIADSSASRCPNYETVKKSAAYLCGVLDERKRKQTNADRIRAMTDEELALRFYRMCINTEFCDECPAVNNCPGVSAWRWEEWLKQPAEVE